MLFVTGFNFYNSEAGLTSVQIASLNQACPGYDNSFENPSARSCCLPCSCHSSVCARKGNFCPDVETGNQTIQISNQRGYVTNQNEHTINQTEHTLEPPVEQTCVTTTTNLNKNKKQLSDNDEKGSKSHLGVTMVTSCLPGINETRCTDPDVTKLNQSSPVHNLDNGLTYRNIFCAQCNNVSDGNTSSLEPWKVFITCSKINIIKADTLLFPSTSESLFTYTATTNYRGCGIDFLPPNDVDIKQSLCFEEANIIRACPDDFNDTSVRAACRDFYMPYISAQENETFVYGNYFCYLCNTHNSDTDNHTCLSNIAIFLHEENVLVAELNAGTRDDSHITPPYQNVQLTPASYVPSGVNCGKETTYDPFLVGSYMY